MWSYTALCDLWRAVATDVDVRATNPMLTDWRSTYEAKLWPESVPAPVRTGNSAVDAAIDLVMETINWFLEWARTRWADREVLDRVWREQLESRDKKDTELSLLGQVDNDWWLFSTLGGAHEAARAIDELYRTDPASADAWAGRLATRVQVVALLEPAPGRF